MPFYLRKAFRFGPFRLNLSKSGIGTSVGVKGLRVGQKPSGQKYLHAGREGLYFRENLGAPRTDNDTTGVEPITPGASYPVKSSRNAGCLVVLTLVLIAVVIVLFLAFLIDGIPTGG